MSEDEANINGRESSWTWFMRKVVETDGPLTSLVLFGVGATLALMFNVLWAPEHPRLTTPFPAGMLVTPPPGASKAEVQAIRDRIDEIAKTGATDGAFAALRSQVTDISVRQGRLEEALSLTPDRMIALPLMRQELESARAASLQHREEMERQLDRLYQQNQWFVGLLATNSITMLLFLFAHFRSRKEASSGASS